MTALNIRFRTGHFGQRQVEDADWHERNDRIFPVYLGEEDRRAIELVLDCLAVGDTKGAQDAFDAKS